MFSVSASHLDSMRLKSLIASFFKVHVSEVHTRIIGEHGESMVPLWSATTIGGIQISNLPAFSGLPVAEMVATVKTSGEASSGIKVQPFSALERQLLLSCRLCSEMRTGS